MPPLEFLVLIASSLIWIYGHSLSGLGLLLFFSVMLLITFFTSALLRMIYFFIFLYSNKIISDEEDNYGFQEINDKMNKEDDRKIVIGIFFVAYVVSFVLGLPVKNCIMIILR